MINLSKEDLDEIVELIEKSAGVTQQASKPIPGIVWEGCVLTPANKEES